MIREVGHFLQIKDTVADTSFEDLNRLDMISLMRLMKGLLLFLEMSIYLKVGLQ